MAKIFEDGFESGDFSAWSGVNVTTGETLTVVTDRVFRGTYAARGTTDGSSQYEQTWVQKTLSPAKSHLFARLYFYIESLTTEHGDYFSMIKFRVGTTEIGAVQVYNYNGELKVRLQCRDGTNYVNTFGGSVQLNTWHCLELEWLNNPTSGYAKAWLDGTQVLSLTGKDTSYYGDCDNVLFGQFCGAAATAPYIVSSVVFDNCVIADEYIGLEPEAPPPAPTAPTITQTISSLVNTMVQLMMLVMMISLLTSIMKAFRTPK
jgi:hypothetical protein